MPIAEMPCSAQQVCPVARLDFEERLGGGANAKVAAPLDFETVTLD
jgi:hypothetical protein